MRRVKSCGVILFRRVPELSFLLMKHTHRFDLPKGHVETGENEVECALRETWDETGIDPQRVTLDFTFRFEETYYPMEPRFGKERVEKTLIIFLGWTEGSQPIQVTEHVGFEWHRWSPPHDIQKFTLNPLVARLNEHFGKETC